MSKLYAAIYNINNEYRFDVYHSDTPISNLNHCYLIDLEIPDGDTIFHTSFDESMADDKIPFLGMLTVYKEGETFPVDQSLTWVEQDGVWYAYDSQDYLNLAEDEDENDLCHVEFSKKFVG